jgi:regulator of ribonuclease activity A
MGRRSDLRAISFLAAYAARRTKVELVGLTAEVVDEHGDRASVCLIQFRGFGQSDFSGRISTVRCLEDNVLLRLRVQEPGDGRVLVVDGGGSFRCALLGDKIARVALENGWSGIVVNGCVRDSDALDGLGLGVKALGTNPRPSRKDGAGAVDVPVTFGGVTFEPGAELHADEDGVVVVAD